MGERQRVAVNVVATNSTQQNPSRYDLLKWVNDSLDLDLKKVEQLCTGAIYCQLVNMLFPATVPINRVKLIANQEYEYIQNFKLLQAAFAKLKVQRTVPVEKLVKGRYQDNHEFLLWFKRFFDANCNPTAEYQEDVYLGREGRKSQRSNSRAQSSISLSRSKSTKSIAKRTESSNRDNDSVEFQCAPIGSDSRKGRASRAPSIANLSKSKSTKSISKRTEYSKQENFTPGHKGVPMERESDNRKLQGHTSRAQSPANLSSSKSTKSILKRTEYYKRDSSPAGHQGVSMANDVHKLQRGANTAEPASSLSRSKSTKSIPNRRENFKREGLIQRPPNTYPPCQRSKTPRSTVEVFDEPVNQSVPSKPCSTYSAQQRIPREFDFDAPMDKESAAKLIKEATEYLADSSSVKKERDFYFEKLRRVEIFVTSLEAEVKDDRTKNFLDQVTAIIFAAPEGFAVHSEPTEDSDADDELSQ